MPTVTLNSTATLFAATNEATYAAARERSGVSYYAAEFGWIGQYFGGSYEVSQVFARFDLSPLPANALITSAKLILTVPESYGTHTVEVREAPAFTAGNAVAFIPGSQLAARTLLGTTNFVDAFNITREIALTNATRAGLANVVLHGLQQRTGVAPTGDTTTRVTVVKLEVTYAVLITTTGAGSWTVPAGVTSVVVECWSGGQGGSADRGGRGGNFAQSTLTVTPGASLSYSIGGGGNGVQYAANVNGGDTWFSSASSLLAKGGGNTSGNIGSTSFYGGAGGGGFQGVAGGGGGSARATQAGGNATTFDGTQSSLQGGASGSTAGGVYGGTTAGGSNIEGGSGGAGLSAGVGGAPGGGGGGGGSSSAGGAGGRGQIRITWTAGGSDPSPITRLHRTFFWL